jgi:hypothetical protein
MRFKIYFPTGYEDLDILDDNIDVNIITQTQSVYFATLFSVRNIISIMGKNKEQYFWAADMVILKDLQLDTIFNTITEIVHSEDLEAVVSRIGDLDSLFSGTSIYPQLKNWSPNAPVVLIR